MNTSNNNHLNILDLPNEILLMIINKLSIVDAFYSLVDMNERFAQLILDPLYIRDLDMTNITMKSFFECTCSVDEQVLSRICETILPQIHSQVNKLTVEQQSMERILLSIHYPKLYSISFVNFQEKTLFQYLKDSSIVHNLLTEQITHLNIDIQNKTRSHLSVVSSDIFILILSLCKRLISLNFCQLFPDRKASICIFTQPQTCCMSESLTKLKINVAYFDDCLYLLDGYLNCLSKLTITVKRIRHAKDYTINSKKLLKLRYFSLSLINKTYGYDYDNGIIPLLRRMINLEESILFLSVVRFDSTVTDGIKLYNDFLINMPRLNKFSFSINTDGIIDNNKIDFTSNEDIQRSFSDKIYGQVNSYVYVGPWITGIKSHIYSLPYQFENFVHLNHCFQGGMFDKVRCLTMNDTYPFEHQLFKVISQDFPFLKELIIDNLVPPQNRQHSSSLITFPHLILLNLVEAHVDYAEQFLVDKNTYLPGLLDLCIKFESLAMVTNNFVKDGTRRTCSQLKRLHMDNLFVRPKNFHKYFPLL